MASSTDKRLTKLEGSTEQKLDPLIIFLPVGGSDVAEDELVEFEFQGCWRLADNLDTVAEIVRAESSNLVEATPFRPANKIST